MDSLSLKDIRLRDYLITEEILKVPIICISTTCLKKDSILEAVHLIMGWCKLQVIAIGNRCKRKQILLLQKQPQEYYIICTFS